MARRRTPGWAAAGIAVAALAAACALSLGIGGNPASPGELLAAALGRGDPYTQAIMATRVPRTLAGLVAGAALACSGVALQAATRNPLGDPGMLGIAGGASAGVVTLTLLAGGGAGGTVGGALAGALAATAAVLALGAPGRGEGGVRTLLAGAVITALAMAYTQAVAMRSLGAFETIRFWSAGSLAVRGIEWPPLAAAAVGAALLAACAHGLDGLALGDDAAAALGHRPGRVRLAAFLGSALLTAAATAVVGPIAFLGLAVPHLAASLTGAGVRARLACSVVLGPAVLLLADVLGRVIAHPAEVPVGVMTAILGAPVLLWVVRRSRAAR